MDYGGYDGIILMLNKMYNIDWVIIDVCGMNIFKGVGTTALKE